MDGRPKSEAAARVVRSIEAGDSHTREFPANFTLDALISTVGGQVSRLLSTFMKRDSVAKLILDVDHVYSNSSAILLIVNQVLNLSSMLLSTIPFGPILPLALQAVVAVLLSPPTRFLAKFLLLRLWQVLPSNPADQFTVSMDNKFNILVHGQNGETNEIVEQTTASQPFGFLFG